MSVAIAILGATVLALLWLLRDERKRSQADRAASEEAWAAERKRSQADRAASEEAWAAERRELLNRIQRPEHVPVGPVPDFKMPEQEPDEFDLVGTIADPDGEE